MNIFEVIQLDERTIAGLPGWSLTRSGRRWVATDPEGTVRASGRIPGNVEAQAQEYVARTAGATPDAEPSRTTQDQEPTQRRSRNPNTRTEPPLTRDPETTRSEPRIDTDDADSTRRSPSTDDTLRALHPDVPAEDQLNRRERRAYNRGRSFERRVRTPNGRGYMRLTITPDMVDEQTRIRSVSGPDIRADRGDGPESRGRNPAAPDTDAPAKGIGGKLWQLISGSRLLKILNALFGTKAAALINTAINASAAEDSLDAFMRAVIDEANAVPESERGAFLNNIESGNFTPGILRAWGESVERFNQLFVEALISVILAGGWIAFVILTGFAIGTGFVGGILSLIAGGAFVVGGTIALYNLLEAVGINDLVENKITSKVFNPTVVLGLSMTVDGAQEFFGTSLDWLTGWTGWSAGDLVRDNVSFDDSAMIKESNNGGVTANQAKEILKNFIKSDPNLVKAYNDGKEEAKEIIRSGDPEELD